MIYKFTNKAKKVIENANDISIELGHNYIGTEHILAGLLKEGSGVAAEVLRANGVELSKLLQMIEELIATGADTLVEERDGYSPRSQHILEKAQEEGINLAKTKLPIFDVSAMLYNEMNK